MMTLTYGSEVWSICDKDDCYSWENDMIARDSNTNSIL